MTIYAGIEHRQAGIGDVRKPKQASTQRSGFRPQFGIFSICIPMVDYNLKDPCFGGTVVGKRKKRSELGAAGSEEPAKVLDFPK
jgi:hypothetical protein